MEADICGVANAALFQPEPHLTVACGSPQLRLLNKHTSHRGSSTAFSYLPALLSIAVAGWPSKELKLRDGRLVGKMHPVRPTSPVNRNIGAASQHLKYMARERNGSGNY